MLKAALPSSSWVVNVASLEDYEDGSVSPPFLSLLPSLGLQKWRVPASWEHQRDPSSVGKELVEASEAVRREPVCRKPIGRIKSDS